MIDNKSINKLKVTGLSVWVLLILYTWFVIIYGTNSRYTSSIENRASFFHSVNMNYYERIHPWIYQDYIFSSDESELNSEQEVSE